MPSTFLFDLDMTLVDSSALATLRRDRLWQRVKANMNLIRPFTAQGHLAPHEVPENLKKAGHRVGIVTSSPRWYAEMVLQQFRIPHDVLIGYDDTQNHKPDPDPLQEALKRLGVKAGANVYYVGDDANDIEASYHASIRSIGVNWGASSVFELSSAAPDIFIAKPGSLLRTDKLHNFGYAAECIAAGIDLVEHWGSILRCDEAPAVYALGRYFTTSDPRHASSPLCAAVLKLKNDDAPAPMFGKALGQMINFLDWSPDFVVPMPPKPSQKRNRFEKLLEVADAALPDDVEVVMDGLKCVKEVANYKTLNALERQEAIRGAFKSGYQWEGEVQILLVDDVYTTGETTKECIRMLREAGAREVRCLTLAKDQRTFARKECSGCGRPMRIRTNSKTAEKFWGCSGYPDHCTNTESL